MSEGPHDAHDREENAEHLKAAAARWSRDRELPMSDRLERVHQLCAQLARLEPVRSKSR